MVKAPSFGYLLRHPVEFLAFGFGSGLSPKAPGTMGTLAAIPLYYFMRDWPWLWYVPMLLITFAVGVYFCQVAAKAQNCHDHPGIVWDEFVGYWLTMFLAPPQWWWMIIGFALFRFFDILKPWPIKMCDKHIHGGFGIMFDDILAGVYAWLCLQGLAYFIT